MWRTTIEEVAWLTWGGIAGKHLHRTAPEWLGLGSPTRHIAFSAGVNVANEVLSAPSLGMARWKRFSANGIDHGSPCGGHRRRAFQESIDCKDTADGRDAGVLIHSETVVWVLVEEEALKLEKDRWDGVGVCPSAFAVNHDASGGDKLSFASVEVLDVHTKERAVIV